MLEGKQIGPFKVEAELGSGAMGAVYRATDTRTDQPVAIKFIAPGLGENDRVFARFEREAEMLKQLRHPNIVRRIAVGKYQKTPFYAMEYIDGETLSQVLERRGKLSWEEVVSLGKQICSALKCAHASGIVHRDLKPSNLMLTRDGTLKLTDFGIAKDLDAEGLTSANCTVGTAAYMSPEQCRGERDLTPKSDLYSMGVLLYELLTGKKPFFAENVMEMFMLHVQGEPDRVSRHVLDCPPWLDTLVDQLLAKKPEQRPADAAMVATVLEEVEKKMADRRSAGVDAAAKIAIKGKTTADRLTAQTLLNARRKKKGKNRRNPWTWIAAAGLGLAAVGVLALIIYVLLPALAPNPDAEFREAVQLVDKGEAMLATEDPGAALEIWYDARGKLNRIINAGDHPFANQAREQVGAIDSGTLYLKLHRTLSGKKDWKALGDETSTSYREFDEQLTKLIQQNPKGSAGHRFVQRIFKDMEPIQAPALVEQAQDRASSVKTWPEALATLRMLHERYPSSPAVQQVEPMVTWLAAFEEARHKVEAGKTVKRAPSLNPAEEDALQALELEDRASELMKQEPLDQEQKQYIKQLQAQARLRWQALAGRTVPAGQAEQQRWVTLARQRLEVDKQTP